MKQYYRVADLIVEMDTFGRTLKQAEPYLIPEEKESDIRIFSVWDDLREIQPQLSDDDCEYLTTGASFYYQLANFDGLLLHSSAVIMDGKAYLFSAPCGTGKSTHTSLWIKAFGEDRVQLLNDDKPALRCIDGKWYAYGTPWSGKYDKNVNARAPLAGLCVLRRGEVNKIEPYGGFSAVHALLEQTTRLKTPDYMEKMLELLDKLITAVPVWRMECNMELDAARLSHRVMSGESEK